MLPRACVQNTSDHEPLAILIILPSLGPRLGDQDPMVVTAGAYNTQWRILLMDCNVKVTYLREVRQSLDLDHWHAVTYRVGRSSHHVAEVFAPCTVY